MSQPQKRFFVNSIFTHFNFNVKFYYKSELLVDRDATLIIEAIRKLPWQIQPSKVKLKSKKGEQPV